MPEVESGGEGGVLDEVGDPGGFAQAFIIARLGGQRLRSYKRKQVPLGLRPFGMTKD